MHKRPVTAVVFIALLSIGTIALAARANSSNSEQNVAEKNASLQLQDDVKRGTLDQAVVDFIQGSGFVTDLVSFRQVVDRLDQSAKQTLLTQFAKLQVRYATAAGQVAALWQPYDGQYSTADLQARTDLIVAFARSHSEELGPLMRELASVRDDIDRLVEKAKASLSESSTAGTSVTG